MTARAGSAGTQIEKAASTASVVGPSVGIAVAVPGLTGGVDEAARHLFGDDELVGRWAPRFLVTRGQRAATAPFFLVRAVFVLIAWRVTGQVRLVHLNMASKGSTVRKMVLAITARLIGLPYVIQLHGCGFDTFYDGLPGWARWPVRSVFAGAHHVLVLGHPFRELVEGPIGVDPARVSILRNAVPLPPLRDREESDEDESTPLILFTGRFGARKGVADLIDALARVTDQPWRAVLAGDGDVEATAARVAERGLTDRIEVRGWQSRETISALLRSADVFVLPSYLEALSVSLLEAMAAGLCCVATSVGAQGEVVEGGRNGLLVTPGDVDGLAAALARAVADSGLREELGAEARRTVEQSCSIEVVIDRLGAVYEEILERS